MSDQAGGGWRNVLVSKYWLLDGVYTQVLGHRVGFLHFRKLDPLAVTH